MFKAKREFEEREEILAYLEVLLEYVKALHANVGSVLGDVAAIRSAMNEDPEEIALLRAKLRMAMAQAKPMIEEAAGCYDGLEEEIAGCKYMN